MPNLHHRRRLFFKGPEAGILSRHVTPPLQSATTFPSDPIDLKSTFALIESYQTISNTEWKWRLIVQKIARRTFSRAFVALQLEVLMPNGCLTGGILALAGVHPSCSRVCWFRGSPCLTWSFPCGNTINNGLERSWRVLIALDSANTHVSRDELIVSYLASLDWMSTKSYESSEFSQAFGSM
jgi:hypothetical protein